MASIVDETLTIQVTYDQALRLSYMAHFPKGDKAGDNKIARSVDAAIHDFEAEVEARPDA